MFGLGMTEIIIILVVVLVIFGAGKLPEIGEGLGKGIKSFKKSVSGEDEIDITPGEDKEKIKDKEKEETKKE
jgi:sec-independent protein translocase protein TatA